MTNNAASREARAIAALRVIASISRDAYSGCCQNIAERALADEAASQPREGVEQAAAMALMYLQTGIMECEQCGHGISTADLDATYELAGVVAPADDTAPTDQAQGGGTPEPTPQDNAEIVERVARALAEYHYADRFQKPASDPHVRANVEGNWQVYSDHARIAIRSLSSSRGEATDG